MTITVNCLVFLLSGCLVLWSAMRLYVSLAVCKDVCISVYVCKYEYEKYKERYGLTLSITAD